MLRRVHLVRGLADASVLSGRGGCVLVGGGSGSGAPRLSVEGGTIAECSAEAGGGVYAVGGVVELRGSTVADCTAESTTGYGIGGGLYVLRAG